MWEDAQVAANGFLEEFEHPLLGTLRGPSPIIRMSATPTRIQRSSPALGEHTEEVLQSLGFTAEQISGFQAQGITN